MDKLGVIVCASFDLRDLTRAANKNAQPDSCERYMARAAQLPWQHPSRPQLSDPWLPMGPYQACGIRLAITVVGSLVWGAGIDTQKNGEIHRSLALVGGHCFGAKHNN